MVRSSKKNRQQVIASLGRVLPDFQNATDGVDAAAAAVLGMNRTDLRCLDLLARRGAMSAGELASATGLTRGAMTTVLDRLERAGYGRRIPNPEDRRGVRFELTEQAHRWIEAIWGPIVEEGMATLDDYATSELQVIVRFLDQARLLQEAHAARIRALPVLDSKTRPPARAALRRTRTRDRSG